MTTYEPTKGVFETGRNIRNFINNNKTVFWEIWKPLLFWVVGLQAFDALIWHFFIPSSEIGFLMGSIISTYFLCCLIISWHRVVVQGPDNAVPMNPFKPKQHEFVYIFEPLLLFSGIFLAAFILAGFLAILHPLLFTFAVLIFYVYAFYLIFRLSFYFPSKAVDGDLTFRQSYRLSKGYVWGMLIAPYLAIWRTIIMYIAYHAFVIFLNIVLADTVFPPALYGFVVMLPVTIYFTPIIYIATVTGLSNYYLYAVQNEPIKS